MKLIVDVMGENPVKKIINGLRKFKSIHSDVELIILGNENEIKNTLTDKDQFTIVNCDKAVTPESHLPSILRDKETSMYKGLSMVQNNEADGMLSAGYTPAYVTLSHLLIKPINGINKPAFMSYVPTSNNRGFIFLDVGANINCSGEDLYQFAIMANIYSKTIRKIENPAINVLNIGTEETKGFEFHKNANELLKNDKSLNYQGFIESRELSSGITDIVVCDGYSGNLGLKALEGCLLAINSLLKKEYKKPKNWLGALFSIGVIKKIKKAFDYKNHAGAFVIGLNKNIVKTHGNAKDKEFFSALCMLYDSVKYDLTKKIEDGINARSK